MQFFAPLVLVLTLLLSGCDSGSSPPAQASAAGHPPLFSLPGDDRSPETQPDTPGAAQELAIAVNPAIRDLAKGEIVTFSAPAERPIELEITNRTVQQNGDVTLVGSTYKEAGEFRMVITSGETGTFGRIRTPSTTYLITTRAGQTVMIDLHGQGNVLVPKRPDDALIPPPKGHQNQAVDTISTTESAPATAAAPPAADGRTTIDLLILYTPGMAVKHADNLTTRLTHLVAEANAAYQNSEVAIFLRLVHTQEINYPDDTSNHTALYTMTDRTEPFSAVESLRLLHGADLVSLVRPFSYEHHGGCGVAWLLGSNGSFAGAESHGYSVVSEGSERIDNTTWYCSELTLTHELGHNMGSHHERANASGQPAYSYSYGYGIADSFGTIMSYIRPETDRFSNPDLICHQEGAITYPCGIDENASDAANNALSLNNSATAIAGFRPARYVADINNDGQINLQDVFESLFIISDQAVNDTGSRYQDINGDGRIGLAEAIYLLQQQQAAE